MRYYPPLESIRGINQETVVTVLAVGDMALGTAIEASVRERGAEAFWRPMRGVLGSCDLRVGNLESVLTESGKTAGRVGTSLKASRDAVTLLTEGGFDAVTCANNHALDYGGLGLMESLRVLDANRVRHCGAGATAREARDPATLTANGLRVAMLGYCDDYLPGLETDGEGVPAEAWHEDILADIRAARSQADLVIVQLHWGYEFALYPLLRHRDRARDYTEAGAHAVLCHHAHVAMGLEMWGSSLIAYGLGNFAFCEHPYFEGGHPWSARSIALKVHFSRVGVVRAEVIPVAVTNNGPVLLDGVARAELLGGLRRISSALNDSEKLLALETKRLARESRRWLQAIGTHAKDAGRIADYRRVMRAPRQRELIEWLCARPEPSAHNAGAALRNFAGNGGSLHDGADELIRGLTAEFRIGSDLPGRLP
jgi:poly-gamma-glutamate synthesis protein (capsule biosynthesis protein)